MNITQFVSDHISEWECPPQVSLEEIDKVIKGIDYAVAELDAVGICFDPLEELKKEFKDIKSNFERD